MPGYNEDYPIGSIVRVANAQALSDFMATWHYHHPLTQEQLAYADQLARVVDVGFYHRGDALYWLSDVPGVWHEVCLRPGASRADERNE